MFRNQGITSGGINPLYRPRIFVASDIGHPGGDNGEQFIVFFRALNLLDSGWLFKSTLEEAEQEVGKYLNQIKKDCDVQDLLVMGKEN